MGNALGRDIEPGEQVIVAAHIFHNRVPIDGRIFTCESGDGMLETASGRIIYGTWPTGRKGKIYGFWIDKEETQRWRTKS